MLDSNRKKKITCFHSTKS